MKIWYGMKELLLFSFHSRAMHLDIIKTITVRFLKRFSKSYWYSLDTMLLHCTPNNICSHTTEL